MKFRHPSGKEIEVEPVYVQPPGEREWWYVQGPNGVVWQRTRGRAVGFFRRKMKRDGWVEVKDEKP